ncbi:MAG TPA: efflux RND transporter periplasmic adaptor subunit [Vicinamibacteria bacterium]|nr:efflux RND transporter periplasmic adaptor subunit [Vicinamibacteria bacterium]
MSIEPYVSSSRGRIASAVAFSALVLLMMAWLTGRFQSKVSADQGMVAERSAAGVRVVAVRRLSVPAVEAAVGTIVPVYESRVASRVLGRVVQVNVIAGQTVRRGDPLVRLDAADLSARLAEARAALEAARSEDEQARRERARGERLHAEGVMADADWERGQTRARTAAAQAERARQAASEAATSLSFATVEAPRNGTVVDKQVNVGDIVRPGDPLFTLYDPSRMQLVGSVREALAVRLEVGQAVEIELASLGESCDAEVTEIVPEADATSRSFSVKAVGSCGPHAYKGMFGRLLIPLGHEDVLVVPRSAIARVGQLDLVDVAVKGRLVRRIVQLGRPSEDGATVQVLSGLREGEEVALAPAVAPGSDG